MPDKAADRSPNVDQATVTGFGKEWSAFDQSKLTGAEYQKLFDGYFSIFPFESLPEDAEGFDLGCGSGRWAAGIADRVGKLHCIDPSAEALAVAKRRLSHRPNIEFHLATADTLPIKASSQDFGYSLGVLHHIPDTSRALADCVRKLKPGAPFLVYLYYSFDQRPAWYRALWSLSDGLRSRIAELPFPMRKTASNAIATTGLLAPGARRGGCRAARCQRVEFPARRLSPPQFLYDEDGCPGPVWHSPGAALFAKRDRANDAVCRADRYSIQRSGAILGGLWPEGTLTASAQPVAKRTTSANLAATTSAE